MNLCGLIKKLVIPKNDSQHESVYKKIFTAPNILSLFRIVLIVPSVYYILMENYILAMILLIISGITDMFDGIVARQLNQITKLGQVLDPVADKLTLVAVVISSSIKFHEIIPIAVILVFKEFMMLTFGIILIHRDITSLSARWYGKLATVLFYVSAVMIVGLEAFYGYSNYILNCMLMGVTAVVMVFAMFKYYFLYWSLLKSKCNTERRDG